MTDKKINNLLQNFYTGTSSLEEEALLEKFFLQENISPEWKSEKKIFEALHYPNIQIPAEAEVEMSHFIDSLEDKERISTKKMRKLNILISSIAASLVLLLGIGIFYQNEKNKELKANVRIIQDKEEAYKQTMKALELFSENFQKGMEPLEKVDEHLTKTQKTVNETINR